MRGRRLFEALLLRSGVITALAAVALVVLADCAVGACPRPAGLAFAGLLTGAGYGIDRLRDVRGPQARAFGVVAVSVVLSGAVALGLVSMPIRVSLLTPLVAVSVLAYCVPILPGRRRVKDVPLIKPFYVATMWSVVVGGCASFPISGAASILVLAQVYFRIALGVIASDVKDLEQDRSDGIITVPGRIGILRTVWLLRLGHLGIAVSYIAAMLAGVLHPPAMAGAADNLLVAAIVGGLSAERNRRAAWISDVACEACALIPLLILLK